MAGDVSPANLPSRGLTHADSPEGLSEVTKAPEASGLGGGEFHLPSALSIAERAKARTSVIILSTASCAFRQFVPP